MYICPLQGSTHRPFLRLEQRDIHEQASIEETDNDYYQKDTNGGKQIICLCYIQHNSEL